MDGLRKFNDLARASGRWTISLYRCPIKRPRDGSRTVPWGKTEFIPNPWVYLYRVEEQQARLAEAAADKSKAVPASIDN